MNTTEPADTLEPTGTRPRYDEYEDSGVEWLGEIPAEWDVVRLKFLADFTGGGTPSKDNREYWGGDIPWVSPKDMKAGRVTETQDQITPEAVEESSTRLVEPGSVLIVVRSGILKHTIPVATNEVEVALNQDLKAVTPNQRLHSRYLAYLVEGRNDTLLLKWTKSGTTVESLEQERISNTEVPVPSFDEQRAIAAYLDRETERIDALIEKKEQLIDLLEEKRTALISRVVTKGLDGDVEMQDSGVEWLGEIPAGWETAKLKFLSPEITVGIVVKPTQHYEPSGVPALRSLNVTERGLRSEDLVYIGEETNEELAKSRVWKGDLVSVRTGQPGTTAVVNEQFDGVNCIDLIIIRRSDAFDSKYLKYFLNSIPAKTQYGAGSEGAIQQHFNVDTAKNLKAPVPPIEEQRRIARSLDSRTSQIDSLINKVEDALKRLEEYRTALISAAVTGQIDAQAAARTLD